MNTPNMDGIAIVGMAGRFPGAANIDEYWANLIAGPLSPMRCATRVAT